MTTAARVFHATDFSRASGPAFARAVAMARANRGELTIAHVLSPVALSMGDGYMPPATYEAIERENRAHAMRRLKALATRARKRGVRVRTLLLTGSPWQEITRAARKGGAGTIVMGTHGRSGLAKLFLGSVAERVVATARCPVLTVRGH